MPYRWDTDTGAAPVITGAAFFDEGDAPLACLHLSAHNSLTPRGFVIFMGVTAGLVAMPLVALLGSPAMWVILPFFLAMLALIWAALTRSWRQGRVTEDVRIWTDRLAVVHCKPSAPTQDWAANAHWVRVHLHPRRGAHHNYLTLTGRETAREVELGRFLTADDRAALHGELQRVLLDASAAARALNR